jgi:Na+/phosphate symporter
MKFLIYELLKELKMKLVEAIALMTTVSLQEKKVLAEVSGKIDELQKSIDDLTTKLNDAELTEEQSAAIQAVVDGAAALDSLVPDAPVIV